MEGNGEDGGQKMLYSAFSESSIYESARLTHALTLSLYKELHMCLHAHDYPHTLTHCHCSNINNASFAWQRYITICHLQAVIPVSCVILLFERIWQPPVWLTMKHLNFFVAEEAGRFFITIREEKWKADHLSPLQPW